MKHYYETDWGECWFKDEKYNLYHREDGPAIYGKINGYKAWFKNGIRHREDGPAIEFPDGSKYWYLDGKPYSEEVYNRLVKLLFLI